LTVQTHAENLLAILNHARESRNLLRSRLITWLHFQCWPKIARRLSTVVKEWDSDPISLLLSEISLRNVEDSIAPLEVPDPAPTVFAFYGLLPDADTSTRYTLTRANYPIWLSCIGRMVMQLRELLPVAEDPNDWQDPTIASLEEVDGLLKSLAVLLRYDAVSDLFSKSSLYEHLQAKVYLSKCPMLTQARVVF
jgi:hypothetical protein